MNYLLLRLSPLVCLDLKMVELVLLLGLIFRQQKMARGKTVLVVLKKKVTLALKTRMVSIPVHQR